MIHTAPEKALIRRCERARLDLLHRARAISQSISDCQRARAPLARDLAEAKAEAKEIENAARVWINPERRMQSIERSQAYLRDVAARISTLDAEIERLRKVQKQAEGDAAAADVVAEALKKTVTNADHEFMTELGLWK